MSRLVLDEVLATRFSDEEPDKYLDLVGKAGAELAMLLRLTIDPGQLGAADRAVYDRWFSRGSVTAHVFKLTNSDGQQDDLSFSVPPSAAQAPAKGGAAPSGPGTATTGATPGSGTAASGTSITRAAEPGGGTQAGARP